MIIYTEQKARRKTNLWHILKFTTLFLIIALLECISIFHYGYIAGGIFLLIIGGLLPSAYMLAKDYGYKNMTLEKLCNISQFVDCTDVAMSKYSSIKGFKISELSTSFFFAQLIAYIMMLFNHNISIGILEPTIIIIAPVLFIPKQKLGIFVYIALLY